MTSVSREAGLFDIRLALTCCERHRRSFFRFNGGSVACCDLPQVNSCQQVCWLSFEIINLDLHRSGSQYPLKLRKSQCLLLLYNRNWLDLARPNQVIYFLWWNPFWLVLIGWKEHYGQSLKCQDAVTDLSNTVSNLDVEILSI